MPSSLVRLTELVRLLQERAYIFAADPQPITDALRHAAGSAEEKLGRRAEMIDSDRKLQEALGRTEQASRWLLAAATLIWLAVGFSGTFGLMQQSALNFFFVAAGILGLHTVMLLGWLLFTFLSRRGSVGFFINPATWIRGKDPVSQAVLRLYLNEWQQPSTRWFVSKILHRLWLAALFGMLAAVILLLLVRQYTFNWESTLLSDDASVRLVALLSWLPAKLGFPTPDATVVLASRLNNDAATAQQWGGLLIGSIVCYGMLPRLAAWFACHLLSRRQRSAVLPLNLPYYQNIIQHWQTRVVDADTQTESVATVSPKISLGHAPKWAVMLETEWFDKQWYRYVLGQDWLDQGCASNREQVAALTNRLQQEPAQLLIGVRAQAMPDRGVLRQLVGLAEAAEGGAVVQLLSDGNNAANIQEYLSRWHEALNERGLPWLDPPGVSQQERQARQSSV
ncbi:MAG: DUF2868 domain-containing protein [Neisseria sp.]|uniref:DUF2868 domain-containing protein n=1 Tax=Neisseria sp. TaxID=192066 RepID=UPI0026DAE7BC|nr:DUF2868 domain-containing protein [Neisseria sp.]MDO4640427.1 DUF2868 domain-containing protein [Neisseria sp.]